MALELDHRVNRMGERLAVVESKTVTLEECLPRIQLLEKGTASMSARLDGIKDTLSDIKTDSHRSMLSIDTLSRRINRLFWTGAGVMLAVGVVASVIQVGGAWGNFDRLMHESNPRISQR